MTTYNYPEYYSGNLILDYQDTEQQSIGDESNFDEMYLSNNDYVDLEFSDAFEQNRNEFEDDLEDLEDDDDQEYDENDWEEEEEEEEEEEDDDYPTESSDEEIEPETFTDDSLKVD